MTDSEPENRLVVRQLEKDWEAALAEQRQLEEDYQRFTRSRPARLTAAELAAIERLARDIPALWQAASTTHADRKRLLRCVIDRVEVTAPDAGEKVRAAIVWAGGSTTAAGLVRPVARISQLSYYPQLVDRLRELAGQGLTARAIADQLAAENIRPAPPARTVPQRRDPPAPAPVRPAGRHRRQPPAHRPAPRPGPMVACRSRPRTRHAGRDAVRMAQPRLGNRTARGRTAAPVDHHR